MPTLRPTDAPDENIAFARGGAAPLPAPMQTRRDVSERRGNARKRLRRRKSDRFSPARFLPEALDGLREHPVFTLEDNPHTGAIPRETWQESDREMLYNAELLRMFRQRIRLVSFLGLLLLPLFTAFYHFLSPATSSEVVGTHFLMIIALAAVAVMCGPVKKLSWARTMSLVGYVFFCMGSAVVVTIVTQDSSMSAGADRAIQFTVLASYVHILLSILLLPYSLWESAIVALIVSASIGAGLFATAPFDDKWIYASQIFVLLTTAFLVLCISHLQNILRRQVFNSAFYLARQAAQMQEMSATDILTGGFNRRHLESLLPNELTRAARFSHPLSLVMFDLDNFKPVNDALGHAAGDEVLKEIWASSAASLREVDTLARFGGDEFLIVLPETEAASARSIAERLRTSTRLRLIERFGPRSLEGHVTLSVGVLTIQSHEAPTLEATLARADELLYSAKRGGKNRLACGEM